MSTSLSRSLAPRLLHQPRPILCSTALHHNHLFSTTTARPNPPGSPLFHLSGLSASRESQHLAREHGRPRTEYSAALDLIRSSEVDPFASAPGARPSAAAAAAARQGLIAPDAGSGAAGAGSGGGWGDKKGGEAQARAAAAAIAQLSAELRVARADNARLTQALALLHGRYRSSERMGTALLVAVLGLLLLLVKPGVLGEVQGWFDREEVAGLLRHWEDRCHWMFAGGIGMPQRGCVTGGEGLGGGCERVEGREDGEGRKEAEGFVSNLPMLSKGAMAAEDGKGFSWKSLLWSSPR